MGSPMQARSIHLSSFDNMFNDRLTGDLQMWTGISVANFSFCRRLCYASIFMCIIWFLSHTVSTFLILTMHEQTAELKLHWWLEFIRLKKDGHVWLRQRWQAHSLQHDSEALSLCGAQSMQGLMAAKGTELCVSHGKGGERTSHLEHHSGGRMLWILPCRAGHIF